MSYIHLAQLSRDIAHNFRSFLISLIFKLSNLSLSPSIHFPIYSHTNRIAFSTHNIPNTISSSYNQLNRPILHLYILSKPQLSQFIIPPHKNNTSSSQTYRKNSSRTNFYNFFIQFNFLYFISRKRRP